LRKENHKVKRIVILASGAGSNAANLLGYFKTSNTAEVVLIASNKANAGVLDIAKAHGVATYLITRANFNETEEFIAYLNVLQIDLILLAGFLWKVPETMVKNFPGQIINIHPALLPKYGGKGMYGHHVHEAVHAAGEKESGITVHWVNEQYDEGAIIAQYAVSLSPEDSPSDIERKVRALEMQWFPSVVERVLLGS
jgi:phosphoribosylglycinamide formyltransferase 1